MSSINLGLLSQFAVKSKAVKNMSVSEARHEVQVTITDKTDKIKSVTLRLARVIVDLSALVPNCDRLEVPLEAVETVTTELNNAIKAGLLDEAIKAVLDRLNKEANKETNQANSTQNKIIETVEAVKQNNQIDPEVERLMKLDEQEALQAQANAARYGTRIIPSSQLNLDGFSRG